MSFLDRKVLKSIESNPNVESVTAKNVRYTTKFIEHALAQHEAGLSAIEIWEDAGFDVSIFKEGYCRKTILRWRTKLNKQGKDSFKEESRGRRKTIRFASIEEEVAYLRAENAFLKELRALEEESQDD